MIDWNEFALHPAVRRLVLTLSEGFRVRVGCIDPAGDWIDLGDGWNHAGSTLYDEFMAASSSWSNGDARASFERAREQWAQEARAAAESGSLAPRRVVDESGFTALVFPLAIDEQDLVGSLVVTGFIPTEQAAPALEQIRSFLPAHLRERLGDEPFRVPQLDRSERKFLDILAQGLVNEMRDQVERHRLNDDKRWSQVTRHAGMIGASDRMQRLFSMIQKVARSNSSVLIEGENGTGKELVAQAVHRQSRRRDAPFVAVNCAAISPELIASELFGHCKGAFSGAHRERAGLFEAAHQGTLLLDEIGDMEPNLQVKLLRVLQEGTFLRVGDSEQRRVDVRVLCATNCDLKKMVAEGRFREDLYYRVKVITLEVPPLRARPTDIPVLASHFMNRAARLHGHEKKELSDACLQHMIAYAWPGNVRELENEIERLVIMSGADRLIEKSLLSPRIAGGTTSGDMMFSALGSLPLPQAVEMLERKMIRDGLERTGWNKTQTAKDLGISRRNLIRKVAHFSLEENS